MGGLHNHEKGILISSRSLMARIRTSPLWLPSQTKSTAPFLIPVEPRAFLVEVMSHKETMVRSDADHKYGRACESRAGEEMRRFR
jgi:hypothetical protein